MTSVPRSMIAALVVIPVLVCAALTFTTFWIVGMMALLSAMGHGSLTREEALPLFVGGGLVTLMGTVISALWVERWMLGPARDRVPVNADLTWKTRAASLVIIVVVGVGGPPLAGAISDWRNSAIATHGGDEERWQMIGKLAFGQPSPEARNTLQAIATNTSDDPEYRAYAASGLRSYPEAMPVLIALAKDASPKVRAAAGAALLPLASDAASWAVVEELALRDPTLLVRETVAKAVAQQQVEPSAADHRARLLAALATGGGPPERLAAATAMGAGSGYDAAIGIVMDTNQLRMTRAEAIESLGAIKDPRAIDVLSKILKSQMEPGFVPAEMDARFRAAAAGALGKLESQDESSLSRAFGNEQWMLPELKQVVSAQLAYRKAVGFFDAKLACLELVGTCVRGRDRDESLIGPALSSLVPRRGYGRQFHAGPPVPADQIAAAHASASSVVAFAYVAVPEVPFDTGIRGFCADDSGQVCYTRDGSAPAVHGGRCPLSAPLPSGAQTVDPYGSPLLLECASR